MQDSCVGVFVSYKSSEHIANFYRRLFNYTGPADSEGVKVKQFWTIVSRLLSKIH